MPEYERDRRHREVSEREVDATRPIHGPQSEYHRVEHEYIERDAYGDEHYRRREIYTRISYVVWTFTGFIAALIGLRVFLRLIAANPANPFVDFVYGMSAVFVNPFMGIVNDPQAGNSVFEINSLIAIVVYILVTLGIMRLVWLILRVTEPTDG